MKRFSLRNKVAIITGGAGFFGLTKLKDLTHVAESILDRVRKSEIVPTKGDLYTCAVDR